MCVYIYLLDPCGEGYEHKHGNVNRFLDQFSDMDNEMCAHNCSNNVECNSYEFYDMECRISSSKRPTSHQVIRSGFIHCSKTGISLV